MIMNSFKIGIHYQRSHIHRRISDSDEHVPMYYADRGDWRLISAISGCYQRITDLFASAGNGMIL